MSMPSWIVPAAEIAAILFSAAAAVYALFHDYKKDGKITIAGHKGIAFIFLASVFAIVTLYGKLVEERDRSRAAEEIAKADARKMTNLTEEVLSLGRLIDFARMRELQFPVVGWSLSTATEN